MGETRSNFPGGCMPDTMEVDQVATDQPHIWVCDCGCPHFYLLMSGDCECAACGVMARGVQCFNLDDAEVKH